MVDRFIFFGYKSLSNHFLICKHECREGINHEKHCIKISKIIDWVFLIRAWNCNDHQRPSGARAVGGLPSRTISPVEYHLRNCSKFRGGSDRYF